jgi:hypothetical protein
VHDELPGDRRILGEDSQLAEAVLGAVTGLAAYGVYRIFK